MTEQTNAELIAEAALISGHYEEGDATGDFIEKLAAALEAAEKRAEAWKRLCGSTETATTEVIEERDQLAAAVESAVATGDQAWGTGNFDWYDLRDILATPATAPADALREHDAQVRAETLREFAGVVREIAALGPQNSGLRTPDHLAEYAATYADRIEKEAGQ